MTGMPTTRIGQIGEPSPITFTPTLRPEWFEGRREQRLARAFGVTQFGVNHLTLEPGAYSSLRHWHEQEDEFVFILEGEVTLIDDNGEHRLTAGMYVAFPAGEANAHHLCNRATAPARLLAVGTRHRGSETVRFPDDANILSAPIVRDAAGDRIVET
jgi:uncharacterized cupin superfamily protein